MTVEIKFDSGQQFQLDAINAVLELFLGQEPADQALALAGDAGQETLEGMQEIVFGNQLMIDDEVIFDNLHAVQESTLPATDRSEWDRKGPLRREFSVEMETGTGKTYAYLRTIAELYLRYRFSKFVIAVPSVAIREGVMTSLRLLKEHIKDLYDGLQYDAYVYDSNQLGRVRQFATSSHLQIMVVNIAALTGNKESRIIHRPTDAMNGYAPIEFLQACHPIVVMDEPQSMSGEAQKAGLETLNPLCTLRYSATHKDRINLVYRLTPVDAYNLGLVKKIEVWPITRDHDLGEDYVEVTKITGRSGTVTATAVIHRETKQGTKPTQVTLRQNDDLVAVSGGRVVYQGWIVEHIHADKGYVEFGNGRHVRVNSTSSGTDDQLQRLMIRSAIEAHLEKELELLRRLARKEIPAPIKPLTLFFIDRVAHYWPSDSKFRAWFESEYQALLDDGRFRVLKAKLPAVEDAHNGYFAVTTKGEAKDARSDSKDAESAYELIMEKKEELLSPEVPLRFIFSHSALAEGWDNPNVFTICNLQDGKSTMRKRQQIGRGLRLPVMANGDRCHHADVNLLSVIANEGFTSFAEALQKEIEQDTGVTFDKSNLIDRSQRKKITLDKKALKSSPFKALWDRISPLTTYRVEFETDAVVAEALKRIEKMDPIEPIKFRVSRHRVGIDRKGVGATASSEKRTVTVERSRALPDVVGELCRRLRLSRATIVRILGATPRLPEVKINPTLFTDQVATAIQHALYVEMAKGIVYSPKAAERYEDTIFERQTETRVHPDRLVDVSKSVVDKIPCDSDVEVKFAKYLDLEAEGVTLFVKLPHDFKVDTPLGGYNPDWAVVVDRGGEESVYLVRETKGTANLDKLQWESEGWKIQFGAAHFEALKVDYNFGNNPKVLIDPEATFVRNAG